jgi:hypothetical protein
VCLSATLPGDELFLSQQPPVTHAITINAQRQNLWPWIRQIGQDRGGFYSYAPLENLVGCQMPTVHHVDPGWKGRAIRETVWFATPKHYRGQAKIIAAVVWPERAFAMVTPKDSGDTAGRWPSAGNALGLYPGAPWRRTDKADCSSARSGADKCFATPDLFWEPAHFVMERKMLLTIKKLSERQALAKSEQTPQT